MKKTYINRGIIWGFLTAVLLTGLMSVLFTALYQNEIIEDTTLRILCGLGQVISSIIGFVICAKMSFGKIAIMVGICMVMYVSVISIIGLTLSEVGLQNWLQLILSTVIGGLIACAICLRKPKRGAYRKRGLR